MNKIRVQNSEILSSVGPSILRGDAIDIIERAIKEADPYLATKNLIHLDGDYLNIGTLNYDLRNCNNIYAFGVGKATQSIALALEEVLGDRIDEGLVVLKQEEHNNLDRIKVITASHPVPDRGSLQAGHELMAIACKANEGDLVISMVTGGSSSLVILPPEGISLEDIQILYNQLLSSGASIFEINAVRKHVSQIKGGRLAQKVFPAELINLTVSDVVGDKLDYITDLTVPDTSHYHDAWNTLDKYYLWDKIPASIADHLHKGIDIESPKTLNGDFHTYIVVPGDAAYQGAVNRCKELGFHTFLYPKEVERESCGEAKDMVSYFKSYLNDGQRKPCALIATGETTVTLQEEQGKGGPNQEFALQAALEINGWDNIVISSIDIDGNDGPTQAAGAIVDGSTVRRGRVVGMDAEEYLRGHSSFYFLDVSNDLVFTGPTGTNVNDIMFILCS